MQCLVTGASGYIGGALVPALVAAGCEVRAVLHRSTAPSPFSDCVYADLATGLPDATLSGVDTVFHLAGLAHSRATPQAYRAVNLRATEQLAAQARDAGVRRFVFLSSVKAALAGADAAAAGDYAGSKAAAEAALLAAAAGGEMAVIVVRPALVYGGDSRGYLRWLERWVRAHLPAPPAGGERAMIARDDLVRLLVLLRDAPVAAPLTLTVSDGESYSARRLHGALCGGLGRRPWLPSPPRGAWKLAARAADVASGQPAGSTWQRLQGSEHHERSDLQTLFGFQPQLTFEDVAGAAGPGVHQP